MIRSTEKSPSKSYNNALRMYALATTAVALCLAFAVGVLAWFYSGAAQTEVLINSNGIKITAELSRYDSIGMDASIEIQNPADSDYITQDYDGTNPVENNLLIGNRLYYKMVITNHSNEQPHTADEDKPGTDVKIELTFEKLDSYRAQVEDLYIANPNNAEIQNIIKRNNGAIMMSLERVLYKVDDGATTEYTVPQNNTLATSYVAGADFFEYPSLAPGETLTVYFVLKCISQSEAINRYNEYRTAIINQITDQTRKARLEAIHQMEIASVILDKTQASTTTISAHLNIRAISVLATQVAVSGE